MKVGMRVWGKGGMYEGQTTAKSKRHLALDARSLLHARNAPAGEYTAQTDAFWTLVKWEGRANGR